MLYTDIYIYLGSPYPHQKWLFVCHILPCDISETVPTKVGWSWLEPPFSSGEGGTSWDKIWAEHSRAIVTIPYFSINGYTNHQNMGGWIVVHTDNKKRLSMIWYNYFWYIFWILAWYGYWCYCDIQEFCQMLRPMHETSWTRINAAGNQWRLNKRSSKRRPDQVHNLTCKSGLWGKKGTHITYAPITSHRTQLPIRVSSHNGSFLGQAQLYHVIQVLPSNMVITCHNNDPRYHAPTHIHTVKPGVVWIASTCNPHCINVTSHNPWDNYNIPLSTLGQVLLGRRWGKLGLGTPKHF